MLSKTTFALFTAIFATSVVNAHGDLTSITGANGISGIGFGVDTSTPRDGSGRNPFEQDTSVINDKKIARGKTGVCGKTAQSGDLDVVAEMAKSIAAGVPTAAADGTVTMVLHQVNQDGSGPYSCEVDPTGTGDSFVPMTIVTDVPGNDLPIIGSRSKAEATDFPLVAQMAAGTKCTGGSGTTCLIRCRNTSINGPFGGCAAVGEPGSGAAAAKSTVTATGNSTVVVTPDKEAAKVAARAYFMEAMVKRSRIGRLLT